MKIAFTGTQKGMTSKQKKCLRIFLLRHDDEFHHGNCIGADEEAHKIARQSGGLQIHVHPCTITTKQAKCEGDVVHPVLEPLKRNRVMVDMTQILVACPDGPEKLRSGTWSTIRYARKIGREVVIFMP